METTSSHRSARRRSRPVPALVLAGVAAALVLAGCGDEEATGPGTPTTAGPGAELTIVVGTKDDPDARGIATLICGADDAEGTEWLAESADDACAALEDQAVLDAFEPTPADVMCTQEYGGDDVASVTGTVVVDGEAVPVDADFSLVNGCEIARWRAVAPLLPSPA